MEPPPPIKRIVELVDTARTVGPDGQVKAAQEIYRIWADNLYEIGTVGLTPMVQGVVVARTQLPKRADHGRQRLAAPQPGQRAHRAVLPRPLRVVAAAAGESRPGYGRRRVARRIADDPIRPAASRPAARPPLPLLGHRLRDRAGAAGRLPHHLRRRRWRRPAARSAPSSSRRCVGSTASISRSACSTSSGCANLLTGNLGPLAGVPASERGADRRAARADRGARAVLLRHHLDRRHPGRHLLGDAPALAARLPAHRPQLHRRGDAELHAGPRADVGGLRVLRHRSSPASSRPSTSRRPGAWPAWSTC